MIPQDTVQEILAVTHVEEIIDEYVNLKRRGVNLIGLCPFHNEKTPSFTVSPAKNLYKCFGCGKGGNAVNFLMDHDHLSYPEALRYLAKRYNIKIEEEVKDESQIQEEQQRQSLLLINEYAQEFFKDQLLNTDEGRAIGLSYFKHRGLLESTIKTFQLGYSPKGRTTFTDLANAKGYNIDSLKQLGLVSQSGYDFYRERVIFPFHAMSGKVIGFGGRILADKAKAPKYLNSPESKLYNKRKTLYGLYQAKSEIRKLSQCILVEGYTDVLSLHQNGIKNVVASSGTSLTIEQVQLIKRFASNAIVLYDGDQAGQNAALRGLDIFLEQDLNVKVVVLPQDADPDSYIRQVGADAFSAYIEENAKDFILRLARSIQDTYEHDPINKSIQVKDLVTTIAKIRDQIKRSLYVKECADILGLPESSLIKEVNRGIKQEINKKEKERLRQKPNQQRYTPDSEGEYYNKEIQEDHSQGIHLKVDHEQYQERDLIRVLMTSGDQIQDEEEQTTIAEYIITNIADLVDSFKNDLYKGIVLEYNDSFESGQLLNQTHFTNHENEEIRMLAVNLLSDKNTYANWEERGVQLQTQKPIEENFVKDSYQAVMRFKLLKIKERIVEFQKVFEQQGEEKSLVFITAYQKLLAERQALALELNTVIV